MPYNHDRLAEIIPYMNSIQQMLNQNNGSTHEGSIYRKLLALQTELQDEMLLLLDPPVKTVHRIKRDINKKDQVQS